MCFFNAWFLLKKKSVVFFYVLISCDSRDKLASRLVLLLAIVLKIFLTVGLQMKQPSVVYICAL